MRTIPWRHRIPRAWQHCQSPCSGTLWQVLLVAIVCGLGALGALEHVGAAGWAPAQGTAQVMATGLAAFQRGDFEGAPGSRLCGARAP